jgi:cytochrome P450
MGITKELPTSATPRQIAELPGPPGLPILGSSLQLDRLRVHHTIEQWNRKYGEIFRFRIGTRQVVAVSNPDLIAAVLRDRPAGFQRTKRLSQTAREFGFGGLFSSNGEDWKRQRPMVLSGLDPTHVKAFFPALLKVTGRLAGRWQRAAAERQDIDLQADLMRYTVDVTAGLAFGSDINTIESDDEVIQQHLDKVLPALFRRLMAPVSYWHYFRLPSDRAFDRHLVALRQAVDGFIVEARKRLAHHPELREHPTNLIESMVAAREVPDSGLSDADVSGNVLTMLLAGEDTTANTLAWFIWLLQQNATARERLTQEVHRVLGPERRMARHEQLAELHYLDACAHETMRIKPIVPLQTTQAVRDTVLGGVALPAGTLVMCVMRPATVDARHFPNPQAFTPERWLGEEAAEQALSSPKRVAMPFGAGPRMCPGRYLALAEVKMVMAMLLAQFEIESVTSPKGEQVEERLSLTMSPIGLKMRLRARQGAGQARTSTTC